MSNTYIYILKDTDVTLWGLTGRERLTRMLKAHEGVGFIMGVSEAPANATILFLRADYLFDPRLLQPLLELEEDMALYASNSHQIVAARVKSAHAQQVLDGLLEEVEIKFLTELPAKQAASFIHAYDPSLLKYDPPEILPIDQESKGRLENELFNGSYKGITDFITLWLWPIPARAAVKLCVHYNISANQVTVFSLFLAIFAGIAFWGGYLVTGLLLGWFMTFLDTVDGKLARVTHTSSKVGNILDHGLDLIHPPLWYLAWGMGIAGVWISPTLVMPLFWIILLAYIGGRLCEGAFELWIAPFRLFLWQPWDSYNRLISARRNPNLVLLSMSLFFDRPDIGFYLVLVWHVISTLVLVMRIYMAYREKRQGGELSTWLSNIDPVRDRHRLEVRLFTRLSKSMVNT